MTWGKLLDFITWDQARKNTSQEKHSEALEEEVAGGVLGKFCGDRLLCVQAVQLRHEEPMLLVSLDAIQALPMPRSMMPCKVNSLIDCLMGGKQAGQANAFPPAQGLGF